MNSIQWFHGFSKRILATFLIAASTHLSISQAPVSYQSVNFPGQYMRFTNWIGSISPITSLQEQAEASFVAYENPLRPGTIFIKPLDYLMHYVRHLGDQIVIGSHDGTPWFYDYASFYVRPGLQGQGFSFESFSRPGHFIRHTNFKLMLHANDGSDLFKNDATFIWNGPLFPTDEMMVLGHVNIVKALVPTPLPTAPEPELAEQERQQALLAQQERDRLLEQKRLEEEQKKQAAILAEQSRQQNLPKLNTYTIWVDCNGYDNLTNTESNNQITVKFFDFNGSLISNQSKVHNFCGVDMYYQTTGINLAAVEISTSGSDVYWMDQVWLLLENAEMAHWGKDRGDGYCLSTDPKDSNGSLKNYIGSRGCKPCMRFDISSRQVIECMNR